MKISVDVSGRFEPVVEFALHFLPDGVAVGANDHAAAHGAVISELSFTDDIKIPARIIFPAWSNFTVGRGALRLLFALAFYRAATIVPFLALRVLRLDWILRGVLLICHSILLKSVSGRLLSAGVRLYRNGPNWVARIERAAKL